MPAVNVSLDDEVYGLVRGLANRNGLTFSAAYRKLAKLGWAHLSGCLEKSNAELAEALDGEDDDAERD